MKRSFVMKISSIDLSDKKDDETQNQNIDAKFEKKIVCKVLELVIYTYSKIFNVNMTI